MLTLESRCQEYYDLCLQHSACSGAMEWLAQLLREAPDITIGKTFEMIDVFLTDEMREKWASWNLKLLGNEFDKKMIDIIISYINSPMESASLYIRCGHMTNDHANILKKNFEGKLPTVEKEIRDKIVSVVDKKE